MDIKDVLTRAQALKFNPDDMVYCFNDSCLKVYYCEYKDISIYSAFPIAFNNVEDCETYGKFVKERMEEFFHGVLFCDDTLIDCKPIKCAETIKINPTGGYSDTHIAMKRFSYYELDDAKKVIAYYKGLEA